MVVCCGIAIFCFFLLFRHRCKVCANGIFFVLYVVSRRISRLANDPTFLCLFWWRMGFFWCFSFVLGHILYTMQRSVKQREEKGREKERENCFIINCSEMNWRWDNWRFSARGSWTLVLFLVVWDGVLCTTFERLNFGVELRTNKMARKFCSFGMSCYERMEGWGFDFFLSNASTLWHDFVQWWRYNRWGRNVLYIF